MAQDAWAKEDFAECFADFRVELCLCRLLSSSTFSVVVVVVFFLVAVGVGVIVAVVVVTWLLLLLLLMLLLLLLLLPQRSGLGGVAARQIIRAKPCPLPPRGFMASALVRVHFDRKGPIGALHLR